MTMERKRLLLPGFISTELCQVFSHPRPRSGQILPVVSRDLLLFPNALPSQHVLKLFLFASEMIGSSITVVCMQLANSRSALWIGHVLTNICLVSRSTV